MRLLVRLGRDADIFELVIAALVRERLLCPAELDDVENLPKTIATFGVWDAIGGIRTCETAAADAENEPTVADLVDRGGLFRQAQGVAQG